MSQYSVSLALLLLLMFLVYRMGKLTVKGTLAGGLIAIGVFAGGGYNGVLILTAFFVMAIIATSWRRSSKERLGLQEANKGKRNAGQVVANGGIAAIIGLSTIFFPSLHHISGFMIAGAFSAATADTLSSELGNIYGSRYFNILSFKKDQRGLDGVVSFEGTVAGLLGSLVIAFIYYCCAYRLLIIPAITLAGLAGNIADSVLGAAFERKGTLGNNFVNLLNTLVGALSALLFISLF